MLGATAAVGLALLVGVEWYVVPGREVGVGATAIADAGVAVGKLVGPTADWQAANSRTLAARSSNSGLTRFILGPLCCLGLACLGWSQLARSGCTAIMSAPYRKVKRARLRARLSPKWPTLRTSPRLRRDCSRAAMSTGAVSTEILRSCGADGGDDARAKAPTQEMGFCCGSRSSQGAS